MSRSGLTDRDWNFTGDRDTYIGRVIIFQKWFDIKFSNEKVLELENTSDE